ncbi:MAG: biotin synthase BioB [Rhodanobacteraceae bacterium]|nr:biotin synthase BioB [Xanthomonadales bacterium]MCP5477027.1 biotin synthase BioB [Rhodanobacteraceae bacterium]
MSSIRHDWTREELAALFDLPLLDLVHQAASVHRQHFDPREVQISTLLSIKTGACPEDCAYCPQSAHFKTGLEVERLLPLATVREHAAQAKAAGATRFCMGAAWRSPRDKDLDAVIEMVEAVRELGLETCVTAGMLRGDQARRLADAGLDYYNHNLDTSPEYYGEIISTRTFDDRLQTLGAVRDAGMKVCCGGIVGMNEARSDRVGLLQALATLPRHPESVPINQLVRVAGTPLGDAAELDAFEFVRTIAVARIAMPASVVRLSAGREQMSAELQALCFLAGANSIFYGERLLTTGNPEVEADRTLFERLGLVGLGVAPGEATAPAAACGERPEHCS